MPNDRTLVLLQHNNPPTYLVRPGVESLDPFGATSYDDDAAAIEAASSHQALLARVDTSWWSGRFRFALVSSRKAVLEPSPPVLLYNGVGYARLVEVWGSDARIIEAARMSTGKGFLGWGPQECAACAGTGEAASDEDTSNTPPCPKCKGAGTLPGDEKLLSFLWRGYHHTPWETVGMVVEYECPIFVERQMVRHGTLRRNELSARYTELPDRAWLPGPGQVRRQPTAGNKQVGVDDQAWRALNERHILDSMQAAYTFSAGVYADLLERGVAREQARSVMPVGIFTRVRVAGSLRNWLHFFGLRLDKHAQAETRELARALAGFASAHFPRSWALFEGYDVDKPVVAEQKEGL